MRVEGRAFLMSQMVNAWIYWWWLKLRILNWTSVYFLIFLKNVVCQAQTLSRVRSVYYSILLTCLLTYFVLLNLSLFYLNSQAFSSRWYCCIGRIGNIMVCYFVSQIPFVLVTNSDKHSRSSAVDFLVLFYYFYYNFSFFTPEVPCHFEDLCSY